MKPERKRKIKVCSYTDSGYALYNPRSEVPFGGAEVQLFFLSKQLAKSKRIKFSMILGKENFKFSKIEKYNGIDLHVCIPVNKSLLNYIKGGIILYLTLLRINPDIVIQRSSGIETFLISLYCKIFGKKLVFSIAHERDATKGALPKLLQPFYNIALHLTDFIVAQNLDQVHLLNKWKGRDVKNIKVIKSGYQINNKNIDINKKEFILWVGRAQRWKRPELFLEIAKSFPNESFVMICNLLEDDTFSKEIVRKAKEISNLRFIEFVPFEKIDSFFRKAKIFINTSSKEGFPNTFVQATKNKTPILSLNVDPESFIQRNKCGFYCNDDLDTLKEKLDLLLTDKNLYREFSRNSFRYAKENHDIGKIAKEWKEILFKLT